MGLLSKEESEKASLKRLDLKDEKKPDLKARGWCVCVAEPRPVCVEGGELGGGEEGNGDQVPPGLQYIHGVRREGQQSSQTIGNGDNSVIVEILRDLFKVIK